MNRLIVLTGAPEPTKLDWSERGLAKNDLFAQAALPDSAHVESPATTTAPVQWRLLAKPGGVRGAAETAVDDATGRGPDRAAARFLTPEDVAPQPSLEGVGSAQESNASMASTATASQTQSDFYDHSLSVHRVIPPALLSELESENTPISRSSFDSDGGTPHSPSAFRAPWQWPILPAPQPADRTNLEDIPNAAYLRSIEPQTMTVNLVVGILSIAAPRSVATGARWGQEKQTELVELVVGDDTGTGFAVTLWLPPEMHVRWKDGATPSADGSRSTLRRNLRLLRPHDIVLLRNVALSSYRDKVYGQSLRKDVTKVDLLFRKKLDREDMGGSYTAQAVNLAQEDDAQLMKVKRVRDWLIHSIAEAEHEGGRGRLRRGGRRKLPPDSQ